MGDFAANVNKKINANKVLSTSNQQQNIEVTSMTNLSTEILAFHQDAQKAIAHYEGSKALFYFNNILISFMQSTTIPLDTYIDKLNLTQLSNAIDSNPNEYLSEIALLTALRVISKVEAISSGVCKSTNFINGFFLSNELPGNLCQHISVVDACKYENEVSRQFDKLVFACFKQVFQTEPNSTPPSSTQLNKPTSSDTVKASNTTTASPTPHPVTPTQQLPSTIIPGDDDIPDADTGVAGDGAGHGDNLHA